MIRAEQGFVGVGPILGANWEPSRVEQSRVHVDQCCTMQCKIDENRREQNRKEEATQNTRLNTPLRSRRVKLRVGISVQVGYRRRQLTVDP